MFLFLNQKSGSSIVQCARYSLEARASDTILEICMDTSPISLFLVSPNSDGMYGVSADVRSRVSEQTMGRPPFPRKHFREKGARSKRGKGPRDHLHSFFPSSDSTHSHTLPEKDVCSRLVDSIYRTLTFPGHYDSLFVPFIAYSFVFGSRK